MVIVVVVTVVDCVVEVVLWCYGSTLFGRDVDVGIIKPHNTY